MHLCSYAAGTLRNIGAINPSMECALALATVPRRERKKKPTWPNTLRYSLTSAYSSTSPPVHTRRTGLPFI